VSTRRFTRQRHRRVRRDDRRVFRHEIVIAGGADAPAAARHSVAELLAGRGNDVTQSDTALLVSELVTNSVRHGGAADLDTIRLTVTLYPSAIRVEVSDPVGGFQPRPVRPDPDRESGRGLGIVDRIASRWGVRTGWPARVWFEVAL
jgi:anti-sigma regulatory factor (Ser/Thr protein kinase)